MRYSLTDNNKGQMSISLTPCLYNPLNGFQYILYNHCSHKWDLPVSGREEIGRRLIRKEASDFLESEVNDNNMSSVKTPSTSY